jgi:molybdenum cofactor cytidylyltransferase
MYKANRIAKYEDIQLIITGMDISRALRFPNNLSKSASCPQEVISFVGAGGKTTALFQLARKIAAGSSTLVTATTHLGVWEIPLADHHIVISNPSDLQLPTGGVTLVTGKVEDDKTKPVDEITLNWLREISKSRHTSLLIEADGSRQKPLKAPAGHEPPIPDFTDTVVIVAGLSALGRPLSDDYVHRAEIFSQLSGLSINQTITSGAIIHMLTHPQGGLKNILPHARRIIFLNQADTPELQSIGGRMARELLDHFDAIIVGSLESARLQRFEHTAGIILAAGEATRFGAPKQLLDWKGKPFVRHVAETALQARLWPVLVVTGFHAAEVESALSGLPVTIVHNPEYQQGQSASIRAGVASLSSKAGSAIFLLADQPQIPVDVIRALVESHGQNMQAILAPLVLEERRANPVLFDRDTFPDLMQLTGHIGGRGIFDKHRVEYLPWHDDILLLDVDKPQDYQKLREIE